MRPTGNRISVVATKLPVCQLGRNTIVRCRSGICPIAGRGENVFFLIIFMLSRAPAYWTKNARVRAVAWHWQSGEEASRFDGFGVKPKCRQVHLSPGANAPRWVVGHKVANTPSNASEEGNQLNA